MLQLRSVLIPADNSGARKLKFIGVPGFSKRRFAGIGDVITCVVDRVDSGAAVTDSQIVWAVIVRTRKEKRRKDGSYIRFDDNAAVILQAKNSKEPKGTRVFGPVAREIKDLGYNKIASLAPEVW